MLRKSVKISSAVNLKMSDSPAITSEFSDNRGALVESSDIAVVKDRHVKRDKRKKHDKHDHVAKLIVVAEKTEKPRCNDGAPGSQGPPGAQGGQGIPGPQIGRAHV